MRGKTCEVKAAAPKGHAPTRGGKANRGNRSGLRNQHQAQAHQMPSFVHTESFPGSYNTPYPQGAYSPDPGVPGYTVPMYHPTIHPYAHAQHQPHGADLFTADHDFRGGGGTAGAPYFFAPPLATPPADRFSGPNGFPLTHQLPANYSQHAYVFIPLVPGPLHPVLPVAKIASILQQHMEPGIQATEEMNGNDEEKERYA